MARLSHLARHARRLIEINVQHYQSENPHNKSTKNSHASAVYSPIAAWIKSSATFPKLLNNRRLRFLGSSKRALVCHSLFITDFKFFLNVLVCRLGYKSVSGDMACAIAIARIMLFISSSLQPRNLLDFS